MIEVGDQFVIEGVYLNVPNPGRRWWQVWKPRLIRSNTLQNFVVEKTMGGPRHTKEPLNERADV